MSNYISIFDLTPGFNVLGKDICKTRRETFPFCNLVYYILEFWQYDSVLSGDLIATPTFTGCMFSVLWVQFVGDQKGDKVAALGDNDLDTCVTQDTSKAVLLKSIVNEFSSLIVTIVTNQDYADAKQVCLQSFRHSWVLLTHYSSGQFAACDKFCGPLNSCNYNGVVNNSSTLFWHRMECNCMTGHCDELALHIVPHHTAALSICDRSLLNEIWFNKHDAKYVLVHRRVSVVYLFITQDYLKSNSIWRMGNL